MKHVRLLTFLLGSAAAGIVACSGGGSAPAPQNSPVLPGRGSTIPLNQQLTFSVIVPPAATLGAIQSALKKRHADTTNPYVSPNTGSVVLQLQTVNGQSFSQAPAAVAPANIPADCIGSTNGCTVTIANVPAGTGSNRFAVQTFSGANATGNLVSSGYIDVQAPSTQPASFGGTALTIGGFAAQLSLVVVPAKNPFILQMPGTAKLDVNAIDPAGAIIIGTSTLVNPIVLTLPQSDAGAFTLNGATTLTLQQPMQTVTLGYNGGIVLSGEVDGSTIDENAAPVDTRVTFAVALPTPSPSPVPSATLKPTPTPSGATPSPSPKPLSIYVYDGAGNTILEYDGVRNIENGHSPSPSQTPRRTFNFAPASDSQYSCNAAGGIAVASDPNQTMYVNSDCSDAQTGMVYYVFSYDGRTMQAPGPNSTPPPPIKSAGIPLTASFESAAGAQVDQTNANLYVGYASGSTGVYTLSLPNLTLSSELGETCLTELQAAQPPVSCTTGQDGFEFFSNFAVDANRFADVPENYATTPPGPVASEFPGEDAVPAFDAAVSNPAPYPINALAGIPTQIGSSNGVPPYVAIDGNALYLLSQGSINSAGGTVIPGLAGCGPAVGGMQNNCADGQFHEYLMGYPSATLPTLDGMNGITNADIGTPPAFILGGDVIGGFGDQFGVPGDDLKVVDGFAYVLNLVPSQSNTTPEIDVYNVAGRSGPSITTPPVARIVFPATVAPTAIGIGPTGTAIGGPSIVRRPHIDIRAWLRARRLRLERLQSRYRRRF